MVQGRREREKKGGEGSGKGSRGVGEVFRDKIPGDTSEKISTSIQFPRGIGPQDGGEGKGDDMLCFFKELLQIRAAVFTL